MPDSMNDFSERTILTTAAWPYANNHLHMGHIAGAYLPADIFSRFQRMRGHRVLMVSGSDSHGTPVTVTAENEGITPEDVFNRYHASFLDTFERLGISFDLFTSTNTKNHADVTQDFFLTLMNKGFLYETEQTLLFDPEVQRFLPDRYIEGTCPKCGSQEARGDQCDDCGSTLDALDLLNPRSKLSSATPVEKPSKHWFLKLSAFSKDISEWLIAKNNWKPQVKNLSLGMIGEELPDRSITRDLTWGVPIPLDNYETKRIYVWFEAVIGYLSAAIEWSESERNKTGNPDIWKDWWIETDSESYYFVGKDNIPFHAIIWPAMLLGYGGLNLPTNVPANQYLMMSGTKASKSRGTAVWMPDVLDHFHPDAIRYVLTASMPETSDSDFTWAEFVRRNNDELVARWGNLVNRVLAMTHKNFDGKVPPAPVTTAPESTMLLAASQDAFLRTGQELDKIEIRKALNEIMEVAAAANKYLEDRAPWAALKNENGGRMHAAETLHIALQVISNLAILFSPILPFSSKQVWEMIGHTSEDSLANWLPQAIIEGATLPAAQPIFAKLDLDSVEDIFVNGAT